MRYINSRIAVLLVMTLLAQSSPLFAQQHIPAARAATFHNTSHGSTYQTVDVMTPAQFVDPPEPVRHTYVAAGTAYGILLGTLWALAHMFVPFT